jgi:dTDP-4-amino-4,6-dideoxygalactose transaminase
MRNLERISLLSQEKRPKVKIAKPFNDEAIEEAVVSILRSGMLVQGEHVKQFEARLSQYIGCRHVIAVNSGTAALQVALGAVKNARGVDEPEVVTSPLSFAATANAAIANGMKPIFADVDPETFNIEPAAIEEQITENTIALEPVDVYGLPADLQTETSYWSWRMRQRRSAPSIWERILVIFLTPPVSAPTPPRICIPVKEVS